MSETTTAPDTITSGGTISDLFEMPFEQESTADPNRRTHIVRPADNGHTAHDDPATAQSVVAEARLLGKEVKALCGHVWVPKFNPEKYPVCERCIEMAGLIDRGEMH